MCSPLLVFTFPLDKCPLQSASPSDKCSPWSTLLPKSALLPKKCSPLVLSPQKVPFSKCSPLKKHIPQSALPSKCALFKVLSSCILRKDTRRHYTWLNLLLHWAPKCKKPQYDFQRASGIRRAFNLARRNNYQETSKTKKLDTTHHPPSIYLHGD